MKKTYKTKIRLGSRTSRARDPKPPKNPRKAIVWYKERIAQQRELLVNYPPSSRLAEYSAKAPAAIRKARAAIRELRSKA